MRPSRVTRADVAKRANVSKSAVSQVLNKMPGIRISEETQDRIREAAEELGYRPNALARAISTGKTNTIAAVLCNNPELFEPYTSQLLRGIWPVIVSRKMRMTIDAMDEDLDGSTHFKERLSDGVLLVAPITELKNLDLLAEANFPAVSVGNEVSPRIDVADLDNRAAGYAATQALTDLGHHRIVHVSGPLDFASSARERFAGYRDALHDAGIPFDERLLLRNKYWSTEEVHPFELLMNEGTDATAVFCACDTVAIECYHICQARGIRVPEDFSIIGIDGWDGMVDRKVMSTVSQPVLDIGEAAIRMLLERLEGYSGPARQVLLRGELIKGETIGPVKR